MAQRKITPGPWSVDFGLCQWILHGRRPQDVIAVTDHDQHLSNREIADAHLLSAAPDLLCLLVQAREFIPLNEATDELRGAIQLALRKAYGDAA